MRKPCRTVAGVSGLPLFRVENTGKCLQNKNLHPLKSYFTRLTRGNVTVAQYKQRKLTTCQLTRAILDS